MDRLTVSQFLYEIQYAKEWAITINAQKEMELVVVYDEHGSCSASYLEPSAVTLGYVKYSAFLNKLNKLISRPEIVRTKKGMT